MSYFQPHHTTLWNMYLTLYHRLLLNICICVLLKHINLLKMPSFNIHEHTPRDVWASHPLRHQPLSDAASVHRPNELHECFHACVHAKKDILHLMWLNSTRTIKLIWLTMRQNGDIVLDTLELCIFDTVFQR